MGKEAGSSPFLLPTIMVYQSIRPRHLDNVEIEALCRALQLNIDLAYLNGVRGDAVDFIKFRHDLNPEAIPVVLLYRYVFYLKIPRSYIVNGFFHRRPGHYDILVQKP